MFVTTTPGKEQQKIKEQSGLEPTWEFAFRRGGSSHTWAAPEQVSHRAPQTQTHLVALKGPLAAPRLCSPPCP